MPTGAPKPWRWTGAGWLSRGSPPGQAAGWGQLPRNFQAPIPHSETGVPAYPAGLGGLSLPLTSPGIEAPISISINRWTKGPWGCRRTDPRPPLPHRELLCQDLGRSQLPALETGSYCTEAEAKYGGPRSGWRSQHSCRDRRALSLQPQTTAREDPRAGPSRDSDSGPCFMPLGLDSHSLVHKPTGAPPLL